MNGGRDEASVYEQLGDEGFRKLVASFYRRIPQDDLLGPLYPSDDMAGAEDRLRGFLVMRFGGPDDYLLIRGHPALRMRHKHFEIDRAVRDRWLEVMRAAVDEVTVPEPSRTALLNFFESAATFLMNRG